MKQSILLLAVVIINILIVIVCIYINYINLIEAYGDGAPYYGRTTNMDKWSDPIPFLVALNIVTIAIISGSIWFFTKFKKN